MRITTWNINSVRLRLPHVERFLKEVRPDVLCLQEIKCLDDQFPSKALAKAGYLHQAVCGQKGYHGVAIIAKKPFEAETREKFCGKEDARHVSVTLKGGTELHNFYVPAGGDIPDPVANEKFAHKLEFLEQMTAMFAGYADKKAIIVGDLNIAPHENDVWSHKKLLKIVSHTPVEVDAMEKLRQAADFTDVMRAVTPADEKLATWWSYRSKDWRASARGRRLDHIWLTPPLAGAALKAGAKALSIHDGARDWVKPSDHAPVTLKVTL